MYKYTNKYTYKYVNMNISAARHLRCKYLHVRRECDIYMYTSSHMYTSQRVVVCCSVLQCVAVCCSVLQCVAVCLCNFVRCECVTFAFDKVVQTHCNTLQHTATNCNTLQHTTARERTWQHTAIHCNTRQHTATHGNTLQHTATHCRTLQHIVTHGNTLQHTATFCNTTHCNTLQHTATYCNTLQHTASQCKTLQHTATHYNTLQCNESHKLHEASLNIFGLRKSIHELYTVAHVKHPQGTERRITNLLQHLNITNSMSHLKNHKLCTNTGTRQTSDGYRDKASRTECGSRIQISRTECRSTYHELHFYLQITNSAQIQARVKHPQGTEIKAITYSAMQVQHAATHCNTLQHSVIPCNSLQHSAPLCNSLQPSATPCNTHIYSIKTITYSAMQVQHTATYCTQAQHTAKHCNTLQHTATRTSTRSRLSPIPLCRFNSLKRTVTHCNTHICIFKAITYFAMPVQHTATHCNTL